MKILEIRFKNLNSLYGEWKIDFRQPEFINEGIFSITGPTGAGKTTVLDAVCLALYGRTPRLKSINAAGNQIMSRLRSECYAEVTFETGMGVYRCNWSQYRARKKIDGKLQQPVHIFAEAESDKILAEKIRDVAVLVEEKTGMDYEQFTRSILLAQGGFAKFLQADASKRAPILEQITGTDIYSNISIKVHEKQREEKETLDSIKSSVEGMNLLDDEAVKIHKDNLHLLNDRLKEKNEQIEAASRYKIWLEKKKGYELKQEDIELARAELKEKKKTVIPVKRKLERADKAADLEGVFMPLLSKREQSSKEAGDLRNLLEKMPELRSQQVEAVERKKRAEHRLENIKKWHRVVKSIISDVKLLDWKIAVDNTDIEQKTKLLADAESSLKEQQAVLANRQEQQGKLAVQIAANEEYLRENMVYAKLETELSGLKEQLRYMKDMQASYQRETAEYKRKQAELDEDREKLAALEAEQAKKKEIAEQKQKDVAALIDKKEIILAGKLLREYKAAEKHKTNELLLRQKIASLQKHRQQLEDNKPCPLCGSVHHPYAEGNIPEVDEVSEELKGLQKIIEQVENIEEQLKLKQGEFAAAKEELRKIEAKHGKLQSWIELQSSDSKKQKDDLLKQEKGIISSKEKLCGAIAVYNIKDDDSEDFKEIEKQLTAKLKIWQQNAKETQELGGQLSRIELELKELTTRVSEGENTLRERQQEVQKLDEEQQKRLAQRKKRFGERIVAEVEKQWDNRLETLEREKDKAVAESNDIDQELISTEKMTKTQKQRVDEVNNDLEQMEREFAEKLRESGFLHEEEFAGARMDGEERKLQWAQVKKLEQEGIDLNNQYETVKKDLQKARAEKLTDRSEEELILELEELNGRKQEVNEDIGRIKQILENNEQRLREVKQKKIEQKKQEQEYHKWDMLHQLIGSADGKKYRNFAQGLTFEMMIAHANQQLRKMSDRYLLIHDSNEPLELNVVDNYQAGETRSTKNLSGGESFLVSLSLALGLSQMASKNVQVDSLFLDEGFGSLDEDALEVALETLSELHHSGKLIGIISHVAALKERISSQIKVIPLTGGKSRLQGPGVERIRQKESS